MAQNVEKEEVLAAMTGKGAKEQMQRMFVKQWKYDTRRKRTTKLVVLWNKRNGWHGKQVCKPPRKYSWKTMTTRTTKSKCNNCRNRSKTNK